MEHLPQPAPRRPLQPGEPLAKNWVRINDQDVDLQMILGQLAQLQRDVAAPLPQSSSFGHFPFRIYQLPSYLRTTPNPATDWLKFCVRAGHYTTAGVPTLATGGDGEVFGYDNTYPLTAGAGTGEVSCTPGVAKFWFWLVTATNVITSGTSLPATGVVPLGYVDTTDTTNQRAYARQIQYGDIQSAPSGGGTQQFKIVSDGGDYWNCNTWDGTTAGGTVVKVAKPYELRCDVGKITSETIDGILFSYAYTAITVSSVITEYKRTATDPNGNIEINYVTPPVIPGKIIVAISFSTGAPSSLSGVSWIFQSAAAWAEV